MENRQDRLIELIESMLSSGWNQTSLSRAIGVSQPTIGRWLAGKNLPEPNSNNFKGLARTTGGTAESLLLYLDSEMSLDKYLSSDTKYSRTPEQIKADILRLDPTEIAAVIAFSAEVLAKKFQYPSTDAVSQNLHSTDNKVPA
ncbi:MAG: helix-turn-helix domain-containing protein [Chroococcidiopsis sp.]